MTAEIKTLVVYPYMQHYRLGVFQEMDKTEGVEYTFASDVVGRHGIKSLPGTAVSRHLVTTRKVIGPLSWQRGLLPVLCRHDYDAVVFFAEINAVSTWIGAIVARLRRKPVLFWTTGWHRPERGVKRLLRNVFYHLSHQLLLYGELGKSIGEKMNFPESKMTVIGNSVETPKIENLDDEKFVFEKTPDSIVLGAVIRLIPVKKLEQILHAVALLQDDKTNKVITVLIVGEGPERENLQALAERLGVHLVMPGAFYGDTALSNVYKVLDVTVVPAAVGLTAIQSMSHGVPVVSNDSAYTQMPEWESIRPGATGELFEMDDVESLADAILRITELPSERRAEISRNCKTEVRENWASSSQAHRIAESIRLFVPTSPPRAKGGKK